MSVGYAMIDTSSTALHNHTNDNGTHNHTTSNLTTTQPHGIGRDIMTTAHVYISLRIVNIVLLLVGFHLLVCAYRKNNVTTTQHLCLINLSLSELTR